MVSVARARQRRLALAVPSHSEDRSPKYRVAPYQGGVIPDGNAGGSDEPRPKPQQPTKRFANRVGATPRPKPASPTRTPPARPPATRQVPTPPRANRFLHGSIAAATSSSRPTSPRDPSNQDASQGGSPLRQVSGVRNHRRTRGRPRPPRSTRFPWPKHEEQTGDSRCHQRFCADQPADPHRLVPRPPDHRSRTGRLPIQNHPLGRPDRNGHRRHRFGHLGPDGILGNRRPRMYWRPVLSVYVAPNAISAITIWPRCSRAAGWTSSGVKAERSMTSDK